MKTEGKGLAGQTLPVHDSACTTEYWLLFPGEWAVSQCGEVQGIKQAVGGLAACVKQFAEQQQDTTRVCQRNVKLLKTKY